jgi:hypothetical protein
MSTLRRSLFMIAVTASATLAWAAGESTASVDDATGLAEAPGVFIWVGVPREVPVAKSLTVRVVIRNRREHEPFKLEDVEISDRYLDGFEFDTSTPQPYEIDHSHGALALNFELQVGAQRSEEILIKLRATKVGMFSGDIDLWPGDDDEFATRRLQTEILDEPEP